MRTMETETTLRNLVSNASWHKDGLHVLPVQDASRLEGLGVRKRNVTGTMPCWSPLLGKFHIKPEWLA
jgi:hypothetical protein